MNLGGEDFLAVLHLLIGGGLRVESLLHRFAPDRVLLKLQLPRVHQPLLPPDRRHLLLVRFCDKNVKLSALYNQIVFETVLVYKVKFQKEYLMVKLLIKIKYS